MVPSFIGPFLKFGILPEKGNIWGMQDMAVGKFTKELSIERFGEMVENRPGKGGRGDSV